MLKLKAKKKESLGTDSLLTKFSSKSRYAEAFRTLRTNLYFSMMEKELNSVVVTSSVQSEGKTNTVANLAYTIAQTGKSVLMVDADLRKPGLSARFNVKKSQGISNLIADVLGRNINDGRISDYGLNDLITLTGLQKRTCIITITDAENEVDLYFLKGELVDIYWKNRPESKKLANTLIHEKILSEEEALLALGHQQKSVRRLGSILIAMGLVSEHDLGKILSLHMMEAFRITVDMIGGKFRVKNVSEDEIKPTTGNGFSFEQLYGEFLSAEDENSCIKKAVDSAIQKTEEKNLYLLPAGNVPPNPSELLGSVRTSYLLKLLKKRFDVIIIDSSPVMPASDALLLAPQVDGVVLVVKSGVTNKKLVKDTVQQLQKAKANILGVLLNQADTKQDGYYKYYSKYYGN